ncbi:MAG: DUF5686 family protein [Prevotella sp.]|nr:DUF5686 family protein [Prevotella sp.]
MASKTYGEGESEAHILQRVLEYKQNMSEPYDTINTNVYIRYYIKTQRRNFLLTTIPTMHAIAKGNREFTGESYNDILVKEGVLLQSVRRLNTGTIPRYRNTMSTLLNYLMPNVYEKSILANQILSPFNAHNTKLYKYNIRRLQEGKVEIVFRPKRHNTQLLSGSAIVEEEMGKILRVRLKGEYDMVNFRIDAEMGSEGQYSLFPKVCDIDATFKFLGNKITSSYHSVYDNPVTLADTVVNSHDMTIMEEVRPTPLPENIKDIYSRHASIINNIDTVELRRESRRWDRVLWDVMGDHLLTRTKGRFGSDGQGYFRLSPILNPLYLSYSKRKGITYKMKLRGSYSFTPNRDISLSFNAGYSFKQHQFYFKAPLKFTYNKRRNAFVAIEVGNGNRITFSSIVNRKINDTLDSLSISRINLKYFKDFYLKLTDNYEITERWGIRPGLVYHERSAVDKAGFSSLGLQTRYFSFAPSLQLRYRPWGKKGAIFTVDYERGIKLNKKYMDYERIELDASWKKQYNRLRSLSTRIGGGLYTSKSRNSYFLDYANFKDENIPIGWNDDWTGEFQLLRSKWYNSSEYYVRTNITYESPLMILSRIPYIGRLMEMERVYMNSLFAEHLHPYIEVGYGFTNRFFSMGAFIATRNLSYDGIGCRFTFELFRDW